jgi:hypothetical protein
MPWAWVIISLTCSSTARHADVAEILEDRGLVEQTHHHALAEVGRQGRQADVDVAPGHLQLDAAVLGDALLGDVEAGHDLDAARHGSVHALGGLGDLVEHAVHPEAHRHMPLEGLDVDVRGAVLDGLGHHRVDEADDGGLVVGVDDVELELLDAAIHVHHPLFVHLFEHGGGGGATVEDLVDGIEQDLLGHQHGLDGRTQEKLNRIEGFEIERIGDAHLDDPAGVPQGQHQLVLAEGHPQGEGQVDLEGLHIEPGLEPQPQDLGLQAAQLVRGDAVVVQQRLGQPLAAAARRLFRLGELVGGEATAAKRRGELLIEVH